MSFKTIIKKKKDLTFVTATNKIAKLRLKINQVTLKQLNCHIMMGTMAMRQPENWLYEIWQKGQDSPCYVMVPNAKVRIICNY